MTRVPYIPGTAPFTPEQRAWLNGYLAGLFADANRDESDVRVEPSPRTQKGPLLVMYGSQTGTAEQLAKRFAKEAENRGFEPRVMELNAFASVDFAKESRLIIITSTWGDGDPPDNAASFWQHLNSDAVPKLGHLNYSVLALGDRNYSDFCGAGRKFDERLEKLGAKRIHPRTDCDVDYEASAKSWIESLWPALENAGAASGTSAERQVLNGAVVAGSREDSKPASAGPDPRYDRNNPFPAHLVTNRRLNAPGSAKDTRHFEISLEGSELTYEVGDALGVMPTNCPALVSDLLQALGCDGEEAVKTPAGAETSLRSALLKSYQITRPSKDFLQAVAERSGATELKSLLNPGGKADLDQWLYGREVIDMLSLYPEARFAATEFVGLLCKLQPRLYSISSSPKAHPGEVHLTVAAVCYESHGRQRKGVCSTFLADRVEINHTPVPVFVQTSHGFRLPDDGDRPIIMIGPSTGIAPFRAFLEERRALGAKGCNWLFFGDQHRACDFLYRAELEAMLAEGTLTRLETAFSRDQPEKVYVQHRMRESAGEFWNWLNRGAHIYVCGDAKRMARDVDAALHEIVRAAGGLSTDSAAEYVQNLKTEKRYQRDVY